MCGTQRTVSITVDQVGWFFLLNYSNIPIKFCLIRKTQVHSSGTRYTVALDSRTSHNPHYDESSDRSSTGDQKRKKAQKQDFVGDKMDKTNEHITGKISKKSKAKINENLTACKDMRRSKKTDKEYQNTTTSTNNKAIENNKMIPDEPEQVNNDDKNLKMNEKHVKLPTTTTKKK